MKNTLPAVRRKEVDCNMLRLVNVMESLVHETMEDMLRDYQGICKCERCKMDLMALALNKIPPAYVCTAKGGVFSRTASLEYQNKVDIIRALSEAIEIVSKNPRH